MGTAQSTEDVPETSSKSAKKSPNRTDQGKWHQFGGNRKEKNLEDENTVISSNVESQLSILRETTQELKDIIENMKELMRQLKNDGFWKVHLFTICKDPATQVQDKLNTLLCVSQRLQNFSDATLKKTAKKYWEDVSKIKSHSDELLLNLSKNAPVPSGICYKAIVEGTDLLQRKLDDFLKVPLQLNVDEEEPKNECWNTDESPHEEPPRMSKRENNLNLHEPILKLISARDQLEDIMVDLEGMMKGRKRRNDVEQVINAKVKKRLITAKHLLYTINKTSSSIYAKKMEFSVQKTRSQAVRADRSLEELLSFLSAMPLGRYQSFYKTFVENVEYLYTLIDEIGQLQHEPSGNNEIHLREEKKNKTGSTNNEEDTVQLLETIDLNALMDKKTFYHSPRPSSSTDSKDFSFQNSDPLVFQQILSKFCEETIHESKTYFKNLNFSKTDGSHAITLRHFLKIESDILNFQMRTASIALNSDGEMNVDKEFFPIISFGLDKNIIMRHQENMKEMLKKIQEELGILEKRFKKKTSIKPLMDENLNRLAFYILSMYNSNEELKAAGEIKEVLNKSYAFSTLTWMFRLLFSMETQETLPETRRTNFEECIDSTKNRFDMMNLD